METQPNPAEVDVTRTEAETRKLDAETKKLEAEVRDLNRKPWERPAAWVAAGSGAVALMAALLTIPSGYFNRQQQIAAQEAELSRLKAEVADAKISADESELKNLQDRAEKLKKENTQAKDNLTNVQGAFVTATAQRDQLERNVVARTVMQEALSALSTDPNKSLVLAMHAVSMGRTPEGGAIPETMDALRKILFVASRIAVTFPNSLDDLGASAAWSPDGTKMAVSRDTTADVFDTGSWQKISLPVLAAANSMRWMDNDHLLLVSNTGLLTVQLSTQKLQRSLVKPPRFPNGGVAKPGDTLIALSRDRQFVIVGGGSFSSNNWKRCSTKNLHPVAGNLGDPHDIKDEMSTEDCVHEFDQWALIAKPAISSDFSRMATISTEKMVLVDLHNGTLIKQVPFADDGNVLDSSQLEWSPDGKYLSEIRQDAKVEIRDGASLDVFSGVDVPEAVYSGAWTTDSRYRIFATPSLLRFWDTTTHQFVFELPIQESQPIATTVSEDGTRLLIQDRSNRGSVYVFEEFRQQSADKLMNLARKSVKGNLTPHDCDLILHQKVCPAIP